ncbi:PPC domain-containing protein [Bacteroidota bacterium]
MGVLATNVEADPSPPTPPDSLINAIEISLLWTSISNNTFATSESGEAAASCSNDAGNSLWWRFVATTSDPVTVDTYDSGFDTILGIWTGTGHPLTEAQCNDDSGGVTSSVTFTPTPFQTYYIRVTGWLDNSGVPQSGEVRVNVNGGFSTVSLTLRALLEGAYAGLDTMSTSVAFDQARPTSQPYADAGFVGTPMEYSGSEALTTFPVGTIDWVLVELRTGSHDSTLVVGSTKALLLMSTGSIVSLGGGTPVFAGVVPGNYYVVVRHRNHLPVLSPGPIDLTGGSGSWSFVDSLGAAHSSGGAPMKELGDGNFAMFACDINVDRQITVSDFNLWLTSTKAVATGYLQEDCNLDSQVTVSDFNLWLTNTKAVASSQVPD